MNRFKRVDLGDRVPEELWTEFRNTTRDGDQNHLPPKGMQEGEVVV